MADKPTMRIAVVGTTYFPKSHVDVIVSRWLEPWPTDAAWGWPRPPYRSRIASMYLAQFPENDKARAQSAKYGVPLYDSIAGALCLGGKQLAVDGVLLIGEHGDYPYNELGQQLYPRKELFDAIVEVFRATGRTAPVFCDKFLSWNFEWARQMQATAEAMGFMLLSSSSIPLCRQKPEVMSLSGRRIADAVAVFYHKDEAYGYHGLEFAQALVEKRAGGESGIRAITVWRDEQVQRQLERGAWNGALMDLAAAACGPPTHEDPQPQPPLAFTMEYADGLRLTHVKLEGRITSWGLAVQLEGDSAPRASAAVMGDESTFYGHFATLCAMVEEAFVTGRQPFSPRRSLLTTGATAAMMAAKAKPGIRHETPQLLIAY